MTGFLRNSRWVVRGAEQVLPEYSNVVSLQVSEGQSQSELNVASLVLKDPQTLDILLVVIAEQYIARGSGTLPVKTCKLKQLP